MLPWWHRKALTQWPPFLNVIALIRSKVYACWKWPRFHRHLKYSSQFHGIRLFGRQRECRLYTAGCGNKMAISLTGPRAVNELGSPVIPGKIMLFYSKIIIIYNFCTSSQETQETQETQISSFYLFEDSRFICDVTSFSDHRDLKIQDGDWITTIFLHFWKRWSYIHVSHIDVITAIYRK